MSQSEKLNIKFTAKAVDAIEKQAQVPIENVVADTSVNSIARVLQYSLWNDDRQAYGVTRDRAIEVIDEYVAGGSDRFDLVLDITEALVDAGFLPRSMNVAKMRESKAKAANLDELSL